MRDSRHPKARTAQRRASGFTLLEVLVVVAIVGILSAYAVPNFMQSMNRASVTAQTSAFASAIRVARTEAIRRGRMVTLCRSDNPEAAAPACAANAGGALGWASGWVIFEDSDPAGTRGTIDAPNETVINVQAPFNGSGGFADQGANGNAVISFSPSGMPFGVIGRTLLALPNQENAAESRLARTVTLSATGRVTITP